ncbi:MAG: hypothetical protein O2805_10185 [Proteobacteria bacterium]|nr:hypothetical protein [Pseudomonadota bacterium]
MNTATGLRATFGTLILITAMGSAVLAQDDGQWIRPGKDLGATR